MSEVASLALGLAERLATIPDFEHRAYDVWPDQPNPPCVIVDGPNEVQDLAMGCDAGIFFFDLVVLVPIRNGIAQAQRDARQYLGNTGELSIKKALENETTLGGRAQCLIVQPDIRSLGDGQVNGTDVFGVVRSVAVYPNP